MEARATLRLPQGPVDLERVEWRFRPLRLVAARLAFDVEVVAKGLDARARLERGFSTTELRDFQARGEATVLSLFAPLAATWQPQGAITVTAPSLAWDGVDLAGRDAPNGAAPRWRCRRFARSAPTARNSWARAARRRCSSRRSRDRCGSPATELSSQGRFAFSGEARGEPSLEPLLDLIGPRRADGWRA